MPRKSNPFRSVADTEESSGNGETWTDSEPEWSEVDSAPSASPHAAVQSTASSGRKRGRDGSDDGTIQTGKRTRRPPRSKLGTAFHQGPEYKKTDFAGRNADGDSDVKSVKMKSILGFRATTLGANQGSKTTDKALEDMERRFGTDELVYGKHVAAHILNGDLGGSGQRGSVNLVPAATSLNSLHSTLEDAVKDNLSAADREFEDAKPDSEEYDHLVNHAVYYSVKASREMPGELFDKFQVRAISGQMESGKFKASKPGAAHFLNIKKVLRPTPAAEA